MFFFCSQSSKLMKSFSKRKNKLGRNVTLSSKFVKFENPVRYGAGAEAPISDFSIYFLNAIQLRVSSFIISPKLLKLWRFYKCKIFSHISEGNSIGSGEGQSFSDIGFPESPVRSTWSSFKSKFSYCICILQSAIRNSSKISCLLKIDTLIYSKNNFINYFKIFGTLIFIFFFSGFSAVLIAFKYSPIKNSKENAYI